MHAPARVQVAALRADAAALDHLRAEHASLTAATAEAERLAALNSELRLILAGSEGAAEEHERLEAAVEEAAALRAGVEEMRAALEGAEEVQVGGTAPHQGIPFHSRPAGRTRCLCRLLLLHGSLRGARCWQLMHESRCALCPAG